LPDGSIRVFNNNYDETEDGSVLGGSNMMRIDPMTRALRVTYGGVPGQQMYTDIRGKYQYLGVEDEHLLVTEFSAGRVFEVNSAGELVWEYVNRYSEDEVAEVSQATRYREEYFTVDDWTCEGAADLTN
jgi:hypothetical protein